MSTLLKKLKQDFKSYQVCRMAFFSTAYQYQEEIESKGLSFKEEVLKAIPAFPYMDYMMMKPLCKVFPENFLNKLADDAARRIYYYGSRVWFTDMAAEVVKCKAHTYEEVDKICAKYAKLNRGPSRVREASNTDDGLKAQLERKNLRILELEQENRALKAEVKVLKADNLKLRKSKVRTRSSSFPRVKA